jgi:ribosomal-protein-serine acetyltransferase
MEQNSIQLQVDPGLVLRKLALSDATSMFNIIDRQREYLGEWLPFIRYTRTIADSEEFVNSVLANEHTKDLVFSIRLHGEFVGLIGFKGTDEENRKTEIGYWLSFDAQGKGIMTKSVATLTEYAFVQLGLNRVQIKCAVDNVASRNIPDRLGYQLEGIERAGERYDSERYFDLAIYSKLKSDLL